jgi:hypothetical protein
MELNLLTHFLGFDYIAGSKVDKYLKDNLELKGTPFVRSQMFGNGISTQKNITLYTIEDPSHRFDLDIYHTRKILTRDDGIFTGGRRSFEEENTLSFVGSLGLVQKEILEKIEDLLQNKYEVRSEVSPIVALKEDIEFKLSNLNLRYL